MKEKITDERLDEMMRSLMANSAIDDEGLRIIADSPNVWRTVQREITAQKKTQKSPWPPANVLRRWLMIGVPVTAAAALIISLIVFRPVTSGDAPKVLAEIPAAANVPLEPSTPDLTLATKPSSAKVEQRTTLDRIRATRSVAAGKLIQMTQKSAKPEAGTLATTNIKREIKTDFIALTYARNPDSGEIVRVKVPSSMMVTLGVVANVEKPSHLVDAEILVGDDGLTRAIRFIRSN